MDLWSFLLLVLLVVIPAVPLLKKYKRRRKIAQAVDALGGDKCYPIIGTTWSLLRAGRKNFWREYLRRNERNAPLFRSWYGQVPVVHLMKPEHMKAVLNTTENINKGFNYNFFRPWIGDGVFTCEKNKWRVQRKLLTPAFHFAILDNFSGTFSTKSQMLADQLLPLANGEFFDIFPFLSRCALDVICETAMGVKIDAMNHHNSDYARAMYGILEKIVERMFNPLYHNKLIYDMTGKGRTHNKYIKTLHSFTERVIGERKEKIRSGKNHLSAGEQQAGKKETRAFLDVLLGINEADKNLRLSFEDVRDEVETFMSGGHDSSTVTTCWTLFLLGNNPDVQEKLHRELDEIFQGEERPVTSQDLLEMRYLERVVKETLRHYTVAPSITRKLSKEIVVDGHRIPPGVMVALHFYELHKDPEQFPDPESFDPDRFLPENSANRHPFAFLPFSGGPRNCIGQKFAMRSIKTTVATLLRRYKVTSLKKPAEVDCFFDVFLRPQGGMQLKLEVRSEK